MAFLLAVWTARAIPATATAAAGVAPLRALATTVATKLRPFHHAFPVNDLDKAREFYGGTLGLPEGRSASRWIDFDLYGHQIVAHLSDKHPFVDHINPVDGDEVPVPHFGVVLLWDEFNELADRLKAKSVKFIIEPHVRFEGMAGEQMTMFFKDPAGNNLEFKAMRSPDHLFRKD